MKFLWGTIRKLVFLKTKEPLNYVVYVSMNATK